MQDKSSYATKSQCTIYPENTPLLYILLLEKYFCSGQKFDLHQDDDTCSSYQVLLLRNP